MNSASVDPLAPIVSIGVPVYNAEKYLEICLRSLLAQSFRDIEVVISDNGSKDGTQKICERFAAADSRIRYFREEINRGASWNFNRVVELSRGKYYRWNSYDDLISPDYLEQCVKSLEEHPGEILCYGLTVIVDAEGAEVEKHPDRISITAERPSDRLREYLYKVGLTNAIYGLMRVDVLRRTPGLEAYPGSDMVLLAELAMLGPFRENRDIVFFRRIHPQASSPANSSLGQLAGWFNPKLAGRLVLPTWEHFSGYLSAIRRVPCSPGERLRCLAVLLFWQKYGYRDLFREAVIGLRYRFSKRPRG